MCVHFAIFILITLISLGYGEPLNQEWNTKSAEIRVGGDSGPKKDHDKTLHGITILIPKKGGPNDSDDGATKAELMKDGAYATVFEKDGKGATKLVYSKTIENSVEVTSNNIGTYVLTSNALIDPFYTAGMLAFDQAPGVKTKIAEITPTKTGVILVAHANSRTIGGWDVDSLVEKLIKVLPEGTYPELSISGCSVDGNIGYNEVMGEKNDVAEFSTDLLGLYEHEPIGRLLLKKLKEKNIIFTTVWMSPYPVRLGDSTTPFLTFPDYATFKNYLHNRWRIKNGKPEIHTISYEYVGARQASDLITKPYDGYSKRQESSVGMENKYQPSFFSLEIERFEFVLLALLFFLVIIFIYKHCFKFKEADNSTPLLLV